MYGKFVVTSNVRRFRAAHDNQDLRGAPESSWTLVTGDAGHGKTRAATHWGLDEHAAIVRIPAGATPHWIMAELVRELDGRVPERSCEGCTRQATRALQANPRPIVLDEVENALRGGIQCLEVIRNLSDLLEVPVVITGREWVASRLMSERQIWSRISGIAEFKPLDLDDMRLLREQLLECRADPAVDPILLERTGGYIREAVNALAVVDSLGARLDRPVTPDDIRGRTLVHEHVFRASPPTRSRAARAKAESGKVVALKPAPEGA